MSDTADGRLEREARTDLYVPPYGSSGDDEFSVWNETPSHLRLVIESGVSHSHITVRHPAECDCGCHAVIAEARRVRMNCITADNAHPTGGQK